MSAAFGGLMWCSLRSHYFGLPKSQRLPVSRPLPAASDGRALPRACGNSIVLALCRARLRVHSGRQAGRHFCFIFSPRKTAPKGGFSLHKRIVSNALRLLTPHLNNNIHYPVFSRQGDDVRVNVSGNQDHSHRFCRAVVVDIVFLVSKKLTD